MKKILLWSFIIILIGCNDVSDVKFENQEVQLAVPIVDTNISISELSEKDQSSYLRLEPDGKITAIYSGELIKDYASSLFPPLPFTQELPIFNSGEFLEIPFPDKYDITKAQFKDTNMSFKYASSYQGTIHLNIRTQYIQDPDGVPFEMNYSWDGDGDANKKIQSPETNMTGDFLLPQSNSLAFEYSAVNDNGNEVELTYLAMVTDVIIFSYVEGYFGKHRFDIDGDFITIGLFGNWISGGLVFEDPKISLTVENAFGFPVRSEVEYIRISSANGITQEVESVYINQGIDFDYPSLSEVGVTKVTEFAFDKDNSNVGILLNDKPTNVNYEMNALANPDDIYDAMEFIGEESFFSVNIGVELPLYGKVNDLVLADTFDLSFSDYDYISESEFKFITKNEFPVDVYLQGYFLDENDAIIDSSFSDKLVIKSPSLLENGRTGTATEQIDFVPFSESRMSKIHNAKKMRIEVKLSSNEVSEESLYIYDDYEFLLKVGALLNIKN